MSTNVAETPSQFKQLKQRAGALWDLAQDHPFVHGIADGSLSRAAFTFFLRQDYVYLLGYSRAIALACAKAPDLHTLQGLSALLSETLGTEMQTHREYCAEFGLSETELAATEPAPVCRAYIDFCIATAATGSVAELLSAILPCAVGYAEIGARIAPIFTEKPAHPYRHWIETYSCAEYQRFAVMMIGVFDSLAAGLPQAQVQRLQELFALGCRSEWLFWDMAWTQQKWPI